MLNRDQLSIKENINLFKYNTGLFFKTCQTLTPDLIHCQYCHVLKILSDETIFRIYDFYDTFFGYLRKFTTTTETYRSLVVCILCPTECGDRNLPSESGRLHFPLSVTSVRNLIKKPNKYIHNKYPNNPILLSQM